MAPKPCLASRSKAGSVHSKQQVLGGQSRASGQKEGQCSQL